MARDAARRDCCDLEAEIELPCLGMTREPALAGAPKPPHLLRANHLERMAVAVARLALDLAEDDRAAPPQDQVELVPARPDVPAEDAVAPEPVVALDQPLKPPPLAGGAQAAAGSGSP